MQENESTKPIQASSPITIRNLLASTVTGTWPKIVIIIFIVELAALFLVSTVPLSQATVSQISGQNSVLAQQSDSLDVIARAIFLFSNNFMIALFEFVPFLGWFFFGYTMYNTALAIEVIGIGANIPGPAITLSLLFEPHSWIELPAYAIATAQSFFLISTVAQRRRFKFEIARTGLVLVIVAVELFIAAIFESAEITMASNLVADFAVPWIAFAILVVLLTLGRKRLLKGYHPYSPVYEQQRMPPMPQYGGQQFSPPPIAPQANLARFCGKCGATVHNPQGAIFCDQCGQRIVQPTVGSASPRNSETPPPFSNPRSEN